MLTPFCVTITGRMLRNRMLLSRSDARRISTRALFTFTVLSLSFTSFSFAPVSFSREKPSTCKRVGCGFSHFFSCFRKALGAVVLAVTCAAERFLGQEEPPLFQGLSLYASQSSRSFDFSYNGHRREFVFWLKTRPHVTVEAWERSLR